MDQTLGYRTFRKRMNETFVKLHSLHTQLEGDPNGSLLTFLDKFNFKEYTAWISLMANYRFYRTFGEIDESFRDFFTRNYIDERLWARDVLRSMQAPAWKEVVDAVYEDVEKWLNDALSIENRLVVEAIRERIPFRFDADVAEWLQLAHLFMFGPVYENWPLLKWMGFLTEYFSLGFASDGDVLIAAGAEKTIGDTASERCVVSAVHQLYAVQSAIGKHRFHHGLQNSPSNGE
jgi:hypothetical protein